MGIIDFLKKIGILKVGSASYKGDASNRPISMIPDDFSDNKKEEDKKKENSTSYPTE